MKSSTREALKLARTVHIYVSMLGFLMFLFFAVTGVLLNHDSFGLDKARTEEASVPLTLDIARAADQHAVAAALRRAAGITLPMVQFNAQPGDIEATFAGPGRRTQALVDRRSGMARITTETRGFAAMLGDLHKGASSGALWKAILDIVSVMLGVSSLTGLVMLAALPRRRTLGILAAAIGTVAALAAWLLAVPR